MTIFRLVLRLSIKNMYKIYLYIFLSIIVGSTQTTVAQLVDYQIRIVEIMATADQSDLQGQDPTWFFWMKDNGTNGSAVTAWVPSGGFYVEDNQFGQWFNGTPNNGPALPFSWQVVVGTDATQIQTEMEGFEKDCPNDLVYESQCYCV